MDKRAAILAELIDKTGSRNAFAEKIGLSPSTLHSILNRGVGRASIDNMIKICRALGISVEELNAMAEGNEIETIAAHHDGEDWTDEELDEIERFKNFVKAKRQQG